MEDNGENRQSIGERLLALRNKNNLTQEELAERLMVSRQSVSKWELSKTLPDVDKLIQLSELYQVSMDYLIIGKRSDREEKEQEDMSLPQNSGDGQVVNGQVSFRLRDSIDGRDASNLAEHLDEEDAWSPQDNQAGQDNHNLKEVLKHREGLKKNTVDRVIQRSSLLVCMLLSGILCMVMLVFAGRLFAVHMFTMEGKKQDLAYVERIQEQYTKAEVTFVNDNGLFVDKHVWLDIPGVREGDYVYYFFDEKDPGTYSFEYYLHTLLLPVIMGIICLIFFITFCMEWKRTR